MQTAVATATEAQAEVTEADAAPEVTEVGEASSEWLAALVSMLSENMNEEKRVVLDHLKVELEAAAALKLKHNELKAEQVKMQAEIQEMKDALGVTVGDEVLFDIQYDLLLKEIEELTVSVWHAEKAVEKAEKIFNDAAL